MIVIRGGEVLSSDGWVRGDVAIDDGFVIGIGQRLSAASVIDATGCLVGPGFVDMHTHLREPGQTWKEDISSASRAAVAGGFTAVTAMPNSDPPMDQAKIVEEVVEKASEVGLVDVIPSGTLTLQRSGASPSDLVGLYDAGVRLYTDDGDSVSDEALLEEVMRSVADLAGALVAQHAEDRSVTADGHMHEGEVSRSLGIGGFPSRAESAMVRRDLAIAERTGCRYHCQHVSAAETVDLIREAKRSGFAVTAEVAPHHLTFDESFLDGLDPNFKMYPPLRSHEDRTALIEALKDGTIDVVATDHAPHLPSEKNVDFSAAPRGVIGLETAASATWEVLLDRDRLFQSLARSPAEILGLADHGGPLREGSTANVVIFDPDARWMADGFRSKSRNSPYRGREMKGQVKATIHRGEVVYEGDITA